jgi:hypothetical protein
MILPDAEPDVQGKEILQHLVHDHRSEYQNLTPQQQDELVAEFEEHKGSMATALRVSVKSRLKDVSHTLLAVEQEVINTLFTLNVRTYTVVPHQLTNLRSRTGAETLLFITRGSTDVAMQPTCFATPGVENFLDGVMKMDVQDFLTKLEGFAVQGIVGPWRLIFSYHPVYI